mgnify:CR=1 FL=1
MIEKKLLAIAEAVLFAAAEPIEHTRLSIVLGTDSEVTLEILDILKEKYETSIYKNQRGAIKGLVIQNQEKFVTLSKEQQSIVLYQILNNLRTSEAADLQLIGGSKNSGKNMISKRINNAEEIILIYQSITGLYKAEVNLLTV